VKYLSGRLFYVPALAVEMRPGVEFEAQTDELGELDTGKFMDAPARSQTTPELRPEQITRLQ